MNNDQGFVKSSIENKVGVITFYHPKSNSLPKEILDELYAQINSLSENNNASIILLKSHGDGPFCSGASFDELKNINTAQDGEIFFSRLSKVILAMKSSPKFIIGRAQGKAVGGGVGLMAACDYTFATESASVKLSELAIGLGPFLIGPAVERKVGTAQFSYMSIDADWRTAVWAKQAGLYTDVYKDISTLDSALNSFLTKASEYSPMAMAELKKALWEGTENWDKLLFTRAAISGKLVLSDYSKRMVASFNK